MWRHTILYKMKFGSEADNTQRADSVASHKKCEEKNNLPFTLLSDPDLSCIQAYDVWHEKKNYGKVSMGVVRTTYLIDEEGMIVQAYDKVKTAQNPAQMLACI